jgi:hypothetical protein
MAQTKPVSAGSPPQKEQEGCFKNGFKMGLNGFVFCAETVLLFRKLLMDSLSRKT